MRREIAGSLRMCRAFAFLAFLASAGLADDLNPMEVPVCEEQPLLDGRLDEPVWQTASLVSNLYLHNRGAPAPETAFYIMRDKAWLYLGAQCRNPHMRHVEQLAYDPDGMVHKDDSLEIFLRPVPEAEATYYHFMLSFAGVGREQRCNQDGLRDASWNPPWRTSTRQSADGWTAEIAIPLYCLDAQDLSGMSLNICRNYMKIELDGMGAKQNENLALHALRPDNQGGFHDLHNFRAVSGLGGFKPELPFVPRIAGADILGMRQGGEGNVYRLALDLALGTPVKGDVLVKVVEDSGRGEVEVLKRRVALKDDLKLELDVPSDAFSEREVKVLLTDPAAGNLLASRAIEDTSALNAIRKAYAERSYYSGEKNGLIHVEFGLPDHLLARSKLTVELGDGEMRELTGLQPVMLYEFPVSALSLGRNKARIRLMLDGQEVAARVLTVTRRQPRPGYETKADFVRGVVLKDNRPFFPFGLYGHTLQRRLGVNGSVEDDEDLFRFLAEDIGLNTIIRSKSATNTVAFMNLAEKYGLKVITWTSPQPHSIGWKSGMWPPPPCDLSLSERLAIQQKEYDAEEPEIIADTKILRDYKNFIAYYNVDEPNLVNPEERIAGAERYWNTITPLDPYRPAFLLYARAIPVGDKWTRWGDILGYDVYPYPHTRGFAGAPGLFTAYYTCQLRERCRRDNKIMWFVPLGNQLDPRRTPVGMSRAQMLCQAYTAIIYGARGLLYFALPGMVGPDAWDALRAVGAQVEALSLALLNGDVPQKINYIPDDFRPRERKFPIVNAAVFKYPDGNYLLLAVNIMPRAADAMFKVGGLEKAVRMFVDEGQVAQSEIGLDGETFNEKIEPYGVRAYRLKINLPSAADCVSTVAAGEKRASAATVPIISDIPAPLEVALEMTALPDERAPSVDVPGIARRVMAGKNHMPNPCFERQFNRGQPDFYKPYFCLSTDPFWGQPGKSDWYVDEAARWQGHPSLRMFRRPLAEGGYKTRGMFGVFYPPVSDKPMKLTFSLYARSENPDAQISIQPGMWPETPMPMQTIRGLSPEWKRHHITFDLPPGTGRDMGVRQFLLFPKEGAVIWISGLQVEQGEKPTEFRDDSAAESENK